MANYSITLTASGSSHYIFNGSDKNGSLVNRQDPTIYVDENDTITFTFNQGGMHPFVIEKSGQSTFGSYVGGDPSTTWTASDGGTWSYRCTNHPSMAGSIIVTAAIVTTTTPDPNAADYSITVTYILGDSSDNATTGRRFSVSGTDRNGTVSGINPNLTFNENDKVDITYINTNSSQFARNFWINRYVTIGTNNFNDHVFGYPGGLSNGSTGRWIAKYWVEQTTSETPPINYVSEAFPLGLDYGTGYTYADADGFSIARGSITITPDPTTTTATPTTATPTTATPTTATPTTATPTTAAPTTDTPTTATPTTAGPTTAGPTTATPTTAAPTPTTAAPTPTTVAPTPTTAAPALPSIPIPADPLGLLPQAESNVLAIREILGTYIHSKALIYKISSKVASNTYGTGNKFHINSVDCPPLTLFRGKTYVFELNDSSLANKKFAFFVTPKIPGESKLNRNTLRFTEGVSYYGTSSLNNAYLIFVVPENAPSTLYYDIDTEEDAGYGNVVDVKNIEPEIKVTTTVAVPDLRFPNDDSNEFDAKSIICEDDGSCIKPVGRGRRSDIRYNVPDYEFLQPLTATTPTPTTEPPATTATPTTFPPDENPYSSIIYPIFTVYKVTVESSTNWAGAGNKYIINDLVSPILSLEQGKTYIFDQSDISNLNHPLRFSDTIDGTHQDGRGLYGDSIKLFGTPGTSGAYSQIKIPFARKVDDKIYYYCQHHSGMGHYIEVTATPQRSDTQLKADPKDFQVTSDASVEVGNYNDYNSYKITQSATITVQYTGVEPFDVPTLDMEYILVGGGGGGGGPPGPAGGGGAGAVSSGVATIREGSYYISIGAGGDSQNAGNPTTFNFIGADGGSPGQSYLGADTPTYTEGSYGGAGGNSNFRVPPIPSNIGSDVLVNTGGSSLSSEFTGGGGGGGAGSAGESVSEDPEGRFIGGKGGDGVSTKYHEGQAFSFAGGGGGGGSGVLLSGSGGSGGGGDYSNKNGTNGSGGAGSSYTTGSTGSTSSGTGGKGLAILRYSNVTEPVYNPNYLNGLKIINISKENLDVNLTWIPSNSVNSVERYFVIYKNSKEPFFLAQQYFHTVDNTTNGTFTFPEYGEYDVAIAVDDNGSFKMGPVENIVLIDTRFTPTITNISISNSKLSFNINNQYDGFVRISYDNVDWELHEIQANQTSKTLQLRLVDVDTKVYIQTGIYLSADQIHLYDNKTSTSYISDTFTGFLEPPGNLVINCGAEKFNTFSFDKNSKANNTVAKITNATNKTKYLFLNDNKFNLFSDTLSDYQHITIGSTYTYVADGANGLRIFTWDVDDGLTLQATFSWNDTATEKCFAKHVELFFYNTLQYIAVTSKDQIVILDVSDILNIFIVAKYEAVGAKSSLAFSGGVIPTCKKLITTHNGLLKYYNITTIIQSDVLVTNPSSFNIGSTEQCELLQRTNQSIPANFSNLKLFVLEEDKVIDYEITGCGTLSKDIEKTATLPVSAHFPPNTTQLNACITNSGNTIELFDSDAPHDVLGSYTFTKKILYHSHAVSFNSNRIFVLDESGEFTTLSYNTSTYIFTLESSIQVSLLDNYGYFKTFSSDGYAHVLTSDRIYTINLSTDKVKIYNQQAEDKFNVQLASNSDSGIGSFKDFGDFTICTVGDDDDGTTAAPTTAGPDDDGTTAAPTTAAPDDPCPAVEATFGNLSYEIQKNGSVLIKGTPSSNNIDGYIVTCDSPRDSKFVPYGDAILIEDIDNTINNKVCIQTIVNGCVSRSRSCIIVQFTIHLPPPMPPNFRFCDEDPKDYYNHQVCWDCSDLSIKYRLSVEWAKDGVVVEKAYYEIDPAPDCVNAPDDDTPDDDTPEKDTHKFPFPDRGPSKRDGGWIISCGLTPRNTYGEGPPATTTKTLDPTLELKPPNRFVATVSLQEINSHWEPPVNLNEFDELVGYEMILVFPDGSIQYYTVGPEINLKIFPGLIPGCYSLSIQAVAKIDDIKYYSPWKTIEPLCVDGGDDNDGPAIMDICIEEQDRIAITISESSSENKSHIVTIEEKRNEGANFSRNIPTTFTGGLGVVSAGLDYNTRYKFSVTSVNSGTYSRSSAIRTILGPPPRIPSIPIVTASSARVRACNFKFKPTSSKDYGWITPCFSVPSSTVSLVVRYKNIVDTNYVTLVFNSPVLNLTIPNLLPVPHTFQFAYKNELYISDWSPEYELTPKSTIIIVCPDGEEPYVEGDDDEKTHTAPDGDDDDGGGGGDDDGGGGDDDGGGGGGGGDDDDDDGTVVTFWYTRNRTVRIEHALNSQVMLFQCPHAQKPHTDDLPNIENSLDRHFLQSRINDNEILIKNNMYYNSGFYYISSRGQAGKRPFSVMEYSDPPIVRTVKQKIAPKASAEVLSSYNGVINFVPIVLNIDRNVVSFSEGSYSSDVYRYEIVLSDGTVYDLGRSGESGTYHSINITRNRKDEEWKGDELSMVAIGYDVNNQIVIESEVTHLTIYGEYEQDLKSVHTVGTQDNTGGGNFITIGRFFFGRQNGLAYYTFGASYFNKRPTVDMVKLGYFPLQVAGATEDNDPLTGELQRKLLSFLQNREPEDAFVAISTKVNNVQITSFSTSLATAVTSNNFWYDPDDINRGELRAFLATGVGNWIGDYMWVVSVMQVRNEENRFEAIYFIDKVYLSPVVMICDRDGEFGGPKCQTSWTSHDTILSFHPSMDECELRRQEKDGNPCLPTTTTSDPYETTTSSSTTTTTDPPPDPTTTPPPPITTTLYPPPWPPEWPEKPWDMCDFVLGLGDFGGLGGEFLNYNLFNRFNTLQNLTIYINGTRVSPSSNKKYAQLGYGGQKGHSGASGSSSHFYLLPIEYFSQVTDRKHTAVLGLNFVHDTENPFQVSEIRSFNIGQHKQVVSYTSEHHLGSESTNSNINRSLEQRFNTGFTQYRTNPKTYAFAVPTEQRNGNIIRDVNDPDFDYKVVYIHTESGWFAAQDNKQYTYFWIQDLNISDEELTLAAEINQTAINSQFGEGLLAATSIFNKCSDLPVFSLHGQAGKGIGYKTTISGNYKIEAEIKIHESHTRNKPVPNPGTVRLSPNGTFSVTKFDFEENYLPLTSPAIGSVSMDIHQVGCFLGEITLNVPETGDSVEILISKAAKESETPDDQDKKNFNLDARDASNQRNNLFKPYGGYIYWHPKDLKFDSNEGKVTFSYDIGDSCWDAQYNGNFWFRSIRTVPADHNNYNKGPSCSNHSNSFGSRLWGDFGSPQARSIDGFTSISDIEVYNRGEGLKRKNSEGVWFPRVATNALSQYHGYGGDLFKYTLSNGNFFIWNGSPLRNTRFAKYIYLPNTEDDYTEFFDVIYVDGDAVVIEGKARKIFKNNKLYWHEYLASEEDTDPIGADFPYPYSKASECFGGKDNDAHYRHYVVWRLDSGN